MVVVATSPVPQLANDIETLLCNHHVMHCDEYVITSHRALALCLARSVSLSLSYSLSSIVLCALVEPNTCVRWPHVYLGSSQVDRHMLEPESPCYRDLVRVLYRELRQSILWHATETWSGSRDSIAKIYEPHSCLHQKTQWPSTGRGNRHFNLHAKPQGR